jgi:predicted transcriptional regulator
MKTPFQIHPTPYRQFPLRLTSDMADRLDEIAKKTRINKTTISRIALQKFIFELEKSGTDRLVDEIFSL